jgi:hypothetical protein
MNSSNATRVVHESAEGSVDACSNLLWSKALERMEGSHIGAFLGKLGAAARRTSGAVEVLAQEGT